MLSAHVPTPTAALTFVGSKLGTAAVKVVCTSAIAGRLTPEVLGHALVSSSSVRAHVQAEALQFVAVRVSMKSPRRLAWLFSLLSEYVAKGGGDGTEAVKLLGRKAVFYHVTSFGIKGTVASALAALAVQAGMVTCQLVSSNARPLLAPRNVQRRVARAKNHRRRARERQQASGPGSDPADAAAQERRAEAEEAAEQREAWAQEKTGMSLAQYCYSLRTAVLSGAGTVVGSGVGAAVGTCVLPGFGTVVGSIVFSFSGGYIPTYLRDGKGPDDRQQAQARELRRFKPLAMVERDADFVEMLPVPPSVADGQGVNDLLDEDALDAEDSVVVLSHRPSGEVDGGEAGGGQATALLADTFPDAQAPAVKTSLFSLAEWTPWLLSSNLAGAEPSATAASPDAGRSDKPHSAQGKDGGEKAPRLPHFSTTKGKDGAAEREGITSSGVASESVSTPRIGSEWSVMDAAEFAPPAPKAAGATLTAVEPDLLTVLGGKIEILPPGLDWAGVDRCVDSYGEEELVLVFHTDPALPTN